MNTTHVTILLPFEHGWADYVEKTIHAFGSPKKPDLPGAAKDQDNPQRKEIDERLDEAGLLHFMSLAVVPGDAEHEAHLLLEVWADGPVRPALRCIEEAMGPQLRKVLDVAGVTVTGELPDFLEQHMHKVGASWFSTLGLDFSGTPEMTVARIRKEQALAREAAAILARTPTSCSALEMLKHVRSTLWENAAGAGETWKWASMPEAAPFLDPAPAQCKGGLPAEIASGILTVFWPYLLIAPLAGAFALYVPGWLDGVVLWLEDIPAWLFAVLDTPSWLFPWVSTLLYTVLVLAAIVVPPLIAAPWRLRRLEDTDPVEDLTPKPDALEEIMRRENHIAQNHLFSVSQRKPGWFRRLSLRVGLWIVGYRSAACGRPGFLADIGVIHFARWIVVPDTDKLVFLSNYSGAWESYLEDFIEKASDGVNAIWSNTRGFPRTRNLSQGGARDGDRLKRWARRQQLPTSFFYCAYPDLTLSRIRLHAEIRRGIACASTEAEAAKWLARFGYPPRPATELAVPEIPSVVFGGLSGLTYGACFFLGLSGDEEKCREWLRRIEGDLAYGDLPPVRNTLVVAFGNGGLNKLGLSADAIKTFPVAFQHGMDKPWRARALGDTGDDAPGTWSWGRPGKEADALLALYAKSPEELRRETDVRRRQIETLGHTIVYELQLKPVPPKTERLKAQPGLGLFEFADSVSQPIIRGTRQAQTTRQRDQIMCPGEFILGYRDNRNYFPPSPSVSDAEDPDGVLPASAWNSLGRPVDFSGGQASDRRDIGSNGTFLVVRQLEDTTEFNASLQEAAAEVCEHAGAPSDSQERRDWIAAKMVGRWSDGTSLVRHPNRPGSHGRRGAEPDNDFAFGTEDEYGQNCPMGAHVRRANPRDSFKPGSEQQRAITNRHRILRMGRFYEAQEKAPRPGLLFMCLNADIERQFEFVQQTWGLSRSFAGLPDEVDPTLGHGARTFTIPTQYGPVCVGLNTDFVRVRGGGYFFVPGRKAIRFLSRAVAGGSVSAPPRPAGHSSAAAGIAPSAVVPGGTKLEPPAPKSPARRSRYRILSLDGGGTWALIQVKALAELYGESCTGHDVLKRFDLIAANSGGSEVVGALAADLTLADVLKLFKRTDVLRRLTPGLTLSRRIRLRMPRLFGVGPLFDTPGKLDALREVLRCGALGVGDIDLTRLPLIVGGTQEAGPHFLITAFDYDRERASFFRSNTSSVAASRLPMRHATTLAEAVHASTTVPINWFASPAEIAGRRYWDGGLAGLNNPVLAAVVEALANGRQASSVDVLSIGAGGVFLPEQGPPGTPDELLLQKDMRSCLASDIRKAGTAIVQDPPDVATFIAHVALGQPLPRDERAPVSGALVRMNPLVQPVRDPQRKWVVPAGLTASDFALLQERNLLAQGEEDIRLIERFAQAWVHDRVPNQPIRADRNLRCEVGHPTFGEAKRAWETVTAR
jgi:deferrochelatase/peroxidase EfeB